MIKFLRRIFNGDEVIRDIPMDKPLPTPTPVGELTVDNLVIPENVSPPVSNIVRVYLRNPGRFQISFHKLLNRSSGLVSVRDKKTDFKAEFQFSGRASWDTRSTRFDVYSKPDWMTNSEAEWVINTLFEFSRERKSKLIRLKKERRERTNKLVRRQVMDMYKDE